MKIHSIVINVITIAVGYNCKYSFISNNLHKLLIITYNALNQYFINYLYSISLNNNKSFEFLFILIWNLFIVILHL